MMAEGLCWIIRHGNLVPSFALHAQRCCLHTELWVERPPTAALDEVAPQ